MSVLAEKVAVVSPESGGAPAAPPASTAPEVVLEPPKSWQVINFRELWHFRDLLYFLTWRDVKIRYKQTFLGAAWAVLQPALMMIVFTIFFRNMVGVRAGDLPGHLSYPLFVYAGLLPWTFFSTAISNAGNSVVGSEKLITKVYFPRLAVPFAAVGAALVDLAVASGLLAMLMLSSGVWPSWSWLLLPLVTLLLILSALGIGTLLAALNVNYRDVRYVIPFFVQVWMFATPSLYMEVFNDSGVELSGWAKACVWLNPLTGVIASFRAAVLGTPMPWASLGLALVVSPLLFFAGCLYFRKVEDSFADVI